MAVQINGISVPASSSVSAANVAINWTDDPRGRKAIGNGARGATKKPVDAPVRIAGHLDRVAPTHHEWT